MNIKTADTEGAQRSMNRRTAFVLVSIALAFFAGVVAKYWFFSAG